MPPNAKSKFVGFSIVVTAIVVCLLVAAIGTPSWKTFSGNSTPATHWGLFATCSGTTCTKFVDETYAAKSFTGSATCVRERQQLINRMNATAGLILGAVVLTFLTVVAQSLHSVGCTVIAKRGHATISWVLSLSAIMSFVGVVVYGGTTSSWLGCGHDICDAFDNTATSCGVGYSFTFAIVGTALLALSALLVLMYTYRPETLPPSGDIIFAVSSISITAMVLLCIGVGTKHWHVIVDQYQGAGLFQQCTPQQCMHNDYSSALVTTTTGCVRELKDAARFNITSATLLIGAAVIMAVFALVFTVLFFANKPIILFTRTKKWFLIGVLIFVEVLQLVGFLLQQNLYDSYWLCGTDLCAKYTGFCTFGMSYGFLVVTMVLTAILIVTHYFELHDWCCFNEKFASGRHDFTIKAAIATVTEHSPRRTLGTSSRPAPPVPPTASAQAAANQFNNIPPSAAAREPALETTVALPPGDWEYDSVSGYYWCEQIFLFYDPESRQYYDPSTDQWINTEGGAAAQHQQELSLMAPSKGGMPNQTV